VALRIRNWSMCGEAMAAGSKVCSSAHQIYEAAAPELVAIKLTRTRWDETLRSRRVQAIANPLTIEMIEAPALLPSRWQLDFRIVHLSLQLDTRTSMLCIVRVLMGLLQ
jgi:hypothetical protein